MEIEISRVLLAFFTGYFLCVSGSLAQLVSNNSIASPSTLGMDGGAVVMVILAQFGIIGFSSGLGLEFSSFLLFLIAFFSICFFSFGKKLSKENKLLKNVWKVADIKGIILMGLAFNLLVGAIFSIVQFMFMAMNVEFPSGIWFGNFKQYEPSFLFLFIACYIICQGFVLTLFQKLEYLNLGTSFSLGVGIDVSRVQQLSLLLSFFLTGLVICFFGVFSFLGLIFPHILRAFGFFKNSMKNELILGPYLCGVVLSGIDVLCYNFTFYGAELPVGMVSSIAGSMFLIFLVLKSRISSF